MEDDILGLHDGSNNSGSEEIKPEQSEPQLIVGNKGGSNRSPVLVTFQCSLEITQPQSGPASVIGVQGYVDWGVNSCSHNANFDWIQGCSFTLAATSYKLRAKLRNSITPGTKVAAKASISYGTKAAVPLQWSTDYVDLPTGNSTVFDIPPWATHGLLVCTPFYLIAAQAIKVEPSTYTGIVRYEVRPADCNESSRFPLSFDVQKLKVTNTSEDNSATVGVIWRLSL